ncbi:1-acyl-sn-glycerol-3-phosphate acyltransferase [Micrococcales bacterium 31B]|nr:1-acyl-sn-glycerol-3-phosphate acyltransferase [Micrococcales bacterium 31B]
MPGLLTRVRGAVAKGGTWASAPPADHVPETFRARRGRRVGRVLVGTLYRVRVDGQHHVPATGPVLLAGNHESFLDGPLLVARSPRPLHVLVKREMFKGFLGWLLPWAGQIPIDRSNGRTALATALRVLKLGGAVGVFPEGTRGEGRVESVQGGVAWLAVAANAPVVPVAIVGARYPRESVHSLPPLGRRIYVHFGEPLHLPPALKGRSGVTAATALIQSHLAAHVARTRELAGSAPAGTTA